MQDTGITLKQLTNWMVNNRKRLWKPRIEARLQQQAQAAVAAVAAQAHAAALSAVTLAQHAAAQQQGQTPTSMTAAKPITPEACFKPTMTMPAPSVNNFVKFDTESSVQYKLSQLKPIAPQPPLPSCSDAATKAVQILMSQQQHTKTISRNPTEKRPALISDAPSSVSTSAATSVVSSDEESSNSAPEENDDAFVVTVEKEPETDGSNDKNYARNVSFCSLELVSGNDGVPRSVSAPAPLTTPAPVPAPVKVSTVDKKKRTRPTSPPTQAAVVTPRKKFRRVGLDMWVDACTKASHNQDESLPSFEEASRLFGFSK
jgi:hypothetical protein